MVNNTISRIQKNIKKYRKKLNLTQEKFAEICEISCDYLSEIERGKTVPSLKRLVLIAEKLGVTIGTLAEEE